MQGRPHVPFRDPRRPDPFVREGCSGGIARGAAALESKKLVVWVMTARDLFNYWEDWAPLGSQ